MIIPATAPSRPACQDPSRDSTCPRSSYVAVASPKYQTLPGVVGGVPVDCLLGERPVPVPYDVAHHAGADTLDQLGPVGDVYALPQPFTVLATTQDRRGAGSQ